MFEISWYSPKSQIRYSLCIGHGSPRYGQLDFITFTKLWMDKGETVNGRLLFSF
jgi:hypothetical protein